MGVEVNVREGEGMFVLHRCQTETTMEMVERGDGEQTLGHRYGHCRKEREGLTRLLDRGTCDRTVG